MSQVRLAAIQPRSYAGPEEHRNVEQCLAWLEGAASVQADLVLFPEGYPGPVNPANDFDALGPLAARARDLSLHVVAGGIQAAGGGRFHVVERLIDDHGEVVGVYRRTTPRAPYVYMDLDTWAVPYTESPTPPAVFETRLGRIGLLVCSEIYVPELSRVLALRGADMIFSPSGGAINELLPSWRTMVWARAIENLVYTATVQNIYADGEEGVATVAAPEGILAQATGPGMLIADLDLDRLRYLREREERIEFPKPYRTIPGVMQWRRPELYSDLTAASDTGAATP